MRKKGFFYCFLLLIPVFLILAGTRGDGQQQVLPSPQVLVKADFGRIPLFFIPNMGQINEQVAFYVQGKDKAIYFTSEGLTFAIYGRRKSGSYSNGKTGESINSKIRGRLFGFEGPASELNSERVARFFDPDGKYQNNEEGETLECWSVRLDFVGANSGVKPEALEETGTIISYFKGKPDEWKTGLRACSKIIYRELWPGVDLVFYGTYERMKYEFVVHPGADPSVIRLAYTGAEKVELTEDGRLRVLTPLGGFEDDVPVAWQGAEGKRVAVSVAYEIPEEMKTGDQKRAEKAEEKNQHFNRVIYGFKVGSYDRDLPLVLDPAVFVYCGYIGGSVEDKGLGIAVDSDGSAYITGETFSSDFPVVIGPDITYNGQGDIFVAKVDASGTHLLYCGFIGGSFGETAFGIAIDDMRNVYITGSTNSSDFPVVVGPSLIYKGNTDAFVAKVDASGTHLLYCGFIGGSEMDVASGIAVDNYGNAYVTGYTRSSDLPVVIGPYLFKNGLTDIFVAKISAGGEEFLYCGYIGGSDDDWGDSIAVDASGIAYITGRTASNDFPVLISPFSTFNGVSDVFLVKVDASGSRLLYSGLIGGSGSDGGRGIALDDSGNVYITGSTSSSDFPVKIGPGLNFKGWLDAFVIKIDASGSDLVYSGYIGGSHIDEGNSIAVDSWGNAYITGSTCSDDFPVVAGPRVIYYGGYDAFVARVNASGTHLDYCSYIGGSIHSVDGLEKGCGIAVDDSGNAYITGVTDVIDFPVVAGPSLIHKGRKDAFVAKIYYYEEPEYLEVTPSGSLSFSGSAGGPFTPASITYLLQNNGGDSINWKATYSASWLSLDKTEGVLNPGQSESVTVYINGNALSLPSGDYYDNILFFEIAGRMRATARTIELIVYVPGSLTVWPEYGLDSSGPVGGPFDPDYKTFSLRNTGNSPIRWSASKSADWISLSKTSGTIYPIPSSNSEEVRVIINDNARNLGPGLYSDLVVFHNLTEGTSYARLVTLYIYKPGHLTVTPPSGLEFSGLAGGPFMPMSASYTLSNTENGTINWSITKSAEWISVDKDQGELDAGASDTVTISLNSNVNSLPPGRYSDIIYFVNETNNRGNTSRVVDLTVRNFVDIKLSGERLTTRTWVLRIEYAKLDIKVTKYGPVNITSYTVMRKSNGQSYTMVKEFSDADFIRNNNFITFNDAPLDRTATYSYMVEAMAADGSFLGRSNEIVLGATSSSTKEAKRLVIERGKK